MVDLTLDKRQLAQLARMVAEHIEQHLATGRSSFKVTEIAQRNGIKPRAVYLDIAEGKLAVVRPGNRPHMRVTTQAEAAWQRAGVGPDAELSERMRSNLRKRKEQP